MTLFIFQVIVSVKRLSDFLHEEEVDTGAITHHDYDGL